MVTVGIGQVCEGGNVLQVVLKTASEFDGVSVLLNRGFETSRHGSNAESEFHHTVYTKYGMQVGDI